jgi:hypothetical protein
MPTWEETRGVRAGPQGRGLFECTDFWALRKKSARCKRRCCTQGYLLVLYRKQRQQRRYYGNKWVPDCDTLSRVKEGSQSNRTFCIRNSVVATSAWSPDISAAFKRGCFDRTDLEQPRDVLCG